VFWATCLDNSSIEDRIEVRKCDILESKLYDEANEPLRNYHVRSAVWTSIQAQQHVASPATQEEEAMSFATVNKLFLGDIKGFKK